ncbi:ATP-binding cassette domain-containing protein [Enterococcus casseliflavus]|uniref:ATP-binding cassette domain-containing protein n=1 Tax=Enterococcus casseliflavus TaxID=37734 RepID=UPI003D09F233
MIKFNQVSIGYGNIHVLKDVNTCINKSELIGLVGPNGSGKSTFLKSIAGIVKPSKGKISFDSEEVTTSFFLNETILVDSLTGYNHLSLLSDSNIKLSKKYIKALNAESFLSKKVKDFSLGMKQILILILTICSDSKIILLDEVLNGLDPVNKMITIEILNNLKLKKIVFLSSHLLEDIQNNADRVFFFENGTIVEANDTDDLELKYLNTFGDKIYEKITKI